MAGEDQERVEDYLELERYIEMLQSGQIAHPPVDLTPEQVHIYQMAALMRSAAPENVEPRADFVEQLRQQLLEINAEPGFQEASSSSEESSANTSLVKPVAREEKKTSKPARFFSRRHVLMGGAVAAASLVVGGGAERIIESETTPTPNKGTGVPSYTSSELKIDATIPTTWHFVVALTDLGQQAVLFAAPTLIGYVLRNADTLNSEYYSKAENIVALSAACTHMGCIVQWEDRDRSFHCPCHSAIFAATGMNMNTHYRLELPPLSRLNVKVENGKVYVEVPQPHK
ncbi:QcrA and Rieske domain-containing protein [Dictyobacter kobayashii]|uniref:(2Fe-2S) ferredoxin n=1 Tax=Dictyobacter kobayashii TaxID=2014872 RepID=A0A402ATA4_9CHLR|nr:Rieske 2Fe-2S domain-containing protein [Dictyobacter kobayashii]GCE22305.1 (2Fe-2S) ferredoxin [Dictyobacter kobayashii]